MIFLTVYGEELLDVSSHLCALIEGKDTGPVSSDTCWQKGNSIKLMPASPQDAIFMGGLQWGTLSILLNVLSNLTILA